MAMRADAASDRQRLGDVLQQPTQCGGIRPAQAETARLFADRLAGFDQAAIGPLPTGREQEPMLQEQSQLTFRTSAWHEFRVSARSGQARVQSVKGERHVGGRDRSTSGGTGQDGHHHRVAVGPPMPPCSRSFLFLRARRSRSQR
jgi:hypothetical protein